MNAQDGAKKADASRAATLIINNKLGENFTRVSEDEAVAFRAVIAELRRQASLLKPRKRGSLRKPIKKPAKKKKP